MSPPVADNECEPGADLWSEWLLHRRHADDPAFAKLVRAATERYADRVLDAARLASGMTLADVGAGEGLITFRAIERVGPSLRVVLTDISAPMLRHVEAIAIKRDVRPQCAFLHCPADQLAAIADTSIDVVTTRAVLAYVADKAAALREFHRILKLGGRLSIAEPILQDDALLANALRTMIETKTGRPGDPFLPLLHRWKAAQYPDTPEKIANSPIANYSERSLFDLVRACGFAEIHMELHIDMQPSVVTSWDVFLGFSPHPWAPPLSVILADQFTPEERQCFEQTVRPIVESPAAVTTTRIVYLDAVKPIATHSSGLVDSAILAIDR
jgi:ubiquinone/menaquinone biosynthesis C-methylase UbiE